MKNYERLLEFLKNRWEEAGRPEFLPLSSYEISKEWTIKKNLRTVIISPVEARTSRTYVHRLLKQLEERGDIKYNTSHKSTPSISLIKWTSK